MKLSIIIPVYYNEGSLSKTHIQISQILDRIKLTDYEIIFVDDGSGDNSFLELIKIKQLDSKVKIIRLSRNFGQVAAIYAGYKSASGDCVVNLAADLQEPSELIEKMIYSFSNENYELVICKREDREEGWYRKVTSLFFYTLIKKLSFENMPLGGFDIVLMSKRIKEILLSNGEANPFWQGQVLWSGFQIKYIPYTRLKREIGKSRWTFSKKVKYLIDGMLAYSYLPLRCMTLLGIFLFVAGIAYSLYITIAYFYGDVPFKGWAPIMILILILSGIQMLMLGILGEYLWRTLDQVRNRPMFLIDKIIE